MNLFQKIKFENLNSNKKKIVRNVFWALLGKVVNMFGNLFVGILVARYLGPSQYGLMNYVISYVAIFTIIASFGLSNIEVRELARTPERKNTIMGTCISMRFFFATLGYMLIFSTVIASNTDRFTTVMILVYGLTLYSNCFEVIRNYFTSIVKNEYVVKSEISRTIIGAIIKIALLFLHAPLEYFIIATLFDTILVASGYCLSYSYTVGNISEWKFDKTIIPFFVKQAFPLLLSGAAVIIYQRIDQIMIGNMIDNESVGYFATAGKFLDIVLFLPGVLTQTVTPMLIKTKENGNTDEYATKCKQFISIVVWISIFLAVFVSLSAYWVIRYTYGEEYLMAIPVLQIMAWKTVGMALSSSGGQIIIIDRIQKWAVIRNLLGCITCIILNFLLIPQYGIIGSSIVTVLTVFVSGFVANYLIPPYRKIFSYELYALFKGWKELVYIKNFIK